MLARGARMIRTARPRTRPMVSASLFTASIGVSACPKRRRKQSNEESGEDAYFVRQVKDYIAVGVFDGVGGWADSGVDPSIFSSGLARHSASVDSKDPSAILQKGYDLLQTDDVVKMGSSTACVATFSLEDASIRIANLGDSGFLLADNHGTIFLESKAQTYFFNAPFQLAKMPDSMRQPGSLENKPADADVTEHQLATGGYLILATDGFLDNVFPEETESILKGHSTAQQLAEKLVKQAVDNGRSNTKQSPFAKEALLHRKRYVGGKEDDVVVVVIAVSPSLQAKL